MIVGIGVDIVEIERIRRALGGSGDRFVQRVFTPGETAFCRGHRDPAPHFAARFAAKEALFKALGTGWAGGLQWREAEVERSAASAPVLVLHGAALARSRKLGAARCLLTLSHSESAAVAVVILEGPGAWTGPGSGPDC